MPTNMPHNQLHSLAFAILSCMVTTNGVDMKCNMLAPSLQLICIDTEVIVGTPILGQSVWWAFCRGTTISGSRLTGLTSTLAEPTGESQTVDSRLPSRSELWSQAQPVYPILSNLAHMII